MHKHLQVTLTMGWNPRYTHPSPYATSDDYLTHPNLLVDMQNPNHTNPWFPFTPYLIKPMLYPWVPPIKKPWIIHMPPHAPHTAYPHRFWRGGDRRYHVELGVDPNKKSQRMHTGFGGEWIVPYGHTYACATRYNINKTPADKAAAAGHSYWEGKCRFIHFFYCWASGSLFSIYLPNSALPFELHIVIRPVWPKGHKDPSLYI